MPEQTQWLIARVVYRKDTEAIGTLKRYEIPVYYPTMFELKPVPRRKLTLTQRNSENVVQRPTETAMFPRYVFVGDPDGIGSWGDIMREAGIAGFTCRENQLVRLRDDELAQLRKQENGGMIDGRKTSRMIFEIGEQVGITSGPFACLPATVAQTLDVPIADLDAQTRLDVLIDLFGRQTRTSIELWQVSKH